VINSLACASNTSGLGACSGSTADVQNYMEYTNPDYQNHFTSGQASRMGSALNNQRYCLVEPNLCTIAAPVALFAVPVNITAGVPVAFHDGSSNHPTGWQWTFTNATPSSSSLPNPTVTFQQVGQQSVTLTVTNAGGSSTVSHSLFVAPNFSPVANFSLSKTLLVQGDSIQFTDLSTSNPTHWRWEIHGPNPLTHIDTQQHPLIRFTHVGRYDVRLLAGNSGGTDDTLLTNAFTVSFYQSPVANFSVSDTLVCKGSTVHFYDQSSNTDPSITSYHWTVAAMNSTLLSLVGSSQHFSVTFNDTGTYRVTYRVINPLSGTGLAIDQITRQAVVKVREVVKPDIAVQDACYGRRNGKVKLTLPAYNYNPHLDYKVVLKNGRVYPFNYGPVFRANNLRPMAVSKIRVYDGRCYSPPFAVTIGENDSIQVEVVQITHSDSGMANGSVTLAVSGGTPPYYLNANQSGITLSPGTPYFGGIQGPYEVHTSLYDSKGCPSNIFHVYIGVNSTPNSTTMINHKLAGNPDLLAQHYLGRPPETPSVAVFPNPAAHRAQVRYQLHRDYRHVELALYDLLGQKQHVLHSGPHAAGAFRLPVELRHLPAGGLYVIMLSASGKRLDVAELVIWP